MQCMKISVIISTLLVTQVSASFFDVFQGAVLSVQNSFGKLLSDVVTDVKVTVDCTILAVEHVLSLSDAANDGYYDKCKGSTTTEPPIVTSLPKLAVSVDIPVDHEYLKQNISEEIDVRINQTLTKILSKYDIRDKIENVEEALAKESDRLADVSSMVKQELDKISNEVTSDLRKIDEKDSHPTVESVLEKINLLQVRERIADNSSVASEIHGVINQVLDKLDDIEANEALENVKLQEIIKDLEVKSNDSFVEIDKEFKDWTVEKSKYLDEIKNKMEEENEIGKNLLTFKDVANHISENTNFISQNEINATSYLNEDPIIATIKSTMNEPLNDTIHKESKDLSAVISALPVVNESVILMNTVYAEFVGNNVTFGKEYTSTSNKTGDSVTNASMAKSSVIISSNGSTTTSSSTKFSTVPLTTGSSFLTITESTMRPSTTESTINATITESTGIPSTTVSSTTESSTLSSTTHITTIQSITESTTISPNREFIYNPSTTESTNVLSTNESTMISSTTESSSIPIITDLTNISSTTESTIVPTINTTISSKTESITIPTTPNSTTILTTAPTTIPSTRESITIKSTTDSTIIPTTEFSTVPSTTESTTILSNSDYTTILPIIEFSNNKSIADDRSIIPSTTKSTTINLTTETTIIPSIKEATTILLMTHPATIPIITNSTNIPLTKKSAIITSTTEFITSPSTTESTIIISNTESNIIPLNNESTTISSSTKSATISTTTESTTIPSTTESVSLSSTTESAAILSITTAESTTTPTLQEITKPAIRNNTQLEAIYKSSSPYKNEGVLKAIKPGSIHDISTKNEPPIKSGIRSSRGPVDFHESSDRPLIIEPSQPATVETTPNISMATMILTTDKPTMSQNARNLEEKTSFDYEAFLKKGRNSAYHKKAIKDAQKLIEDSKRTNIIINKILKNRKSARSLFNNYPVSQNLR